MFYKTYVSLWYEYKRKTLKRVNSNLKTTTMPWDEAHPNHN